MICPFCKEAGEESRVTPGTTSVTLMSSPPGHYDEKGAWVPGRNPNWNTTFYSCTRGHAFTVRSREGAADEVRLIATTIATTTVIP